MFLDKEYLRLANLTAQYTNPSVMDIKMGPRTWDIEATEEKRKTEEAKYPPGKKIGFQIRGFKVYLAKCRYPFDMSNRL